MPSDATLAQALPDILSIARYAPSVHNTQPWRVSVEANTLTVQLDPSHTLIDGDPTGRQTIISLGIFCEALCLAAVKYGWELDRFDLQPQKVVLYFNAGTSGLSDNNQTIELLRQRCSDRSIYTPAPLPDNFIPTIHDVAAPEGITIQVITDGKILEQIADLTSKGIRLALSSPSFRRELSSYLVLPWSRKKRGIAVQSLYLAWPLMIWEPLLLRLGWGLGAEARLERKRWQSASAVVAILADGDLARYWFDTGQAYLGVSLAIESAGLSQATSAAIVEASNYHDDIEAALGTKQRLLALIRVGKGSARRYYSPRVAVDDLLH